MTAFADLLAQLLDAPAAAPALAGARACAPDAIDALSWGALATEPANRPAWAKTLGVSAECSEEELKRAYRRRALEVHPDRGGSAEDFAHVQRAFERGLESIRSATPVVDARVSYAAAAYRRAA